ncbi:MAG: hypothetical protein ABIR39_13595, partial [Nocardioides sp.]|uniref:hypothetical protein n=1 Tax=Nocardioides sp. TaxID=35761 RepID=UPI003265590B
MITPDHGGAKASAKRAPRKAPAARKAATPRKKAAPGKTVAPIRVPVPTGPEPIATTATDAAFAPAAPSDAPRRAMRNMSEVRHFFRTNDVPIYFIGATPFNLLGLDRWVR